MFYFSVFVFGKLNRHTEPVTRQRLNEMIAWAHDYGWSWSATTA